MPPPVRYQTSNIAFCKRFLDSVNAMPEAYHFWMNSMSRIMGIRKLWPFFYAEAVWAAMSSNSTRRSFTKLRLWRKEQQLRNGHALVGNGSTHVVLLRGTPWECHKKDAVRRHLVAVLVEEGVAQFDPSCSATGLSLADPLSGGFHTTASVHYPVLRWCAPKKPMAQ
jgi:hypothetical protein